MATSIKICGLTDEAAVRAAVDAGADYVGFVFFPASPRHVTLAQAAELRALLPARVQSVMVVVDADDRLLADIQAVVAPDVVQLHGEETPERVRAVREMLPGVKVMKAIGVRCGDDVALAHGFSDADMLLFDAKAPLLPLPLEEGGGEGASAENRGKAPHPSPSPKGEGTGFLPGGNGLSFDWALMRGRAFVLPWMLSGGLNAGNVAAALAGTGAKMVDVSSGVELSPGVKDAALMQAFVKAVRDYDKI